MHRFAGSGTSRFDDGRHRQVALGRRWRADADRPIGGGNVGGVSIGVGIDRDALDPGLAARPGDADRNLAAIGDQHTTERHAFQLGLRFSRNARSPSWPSSDTRWVVMPMTSSGCAPAISRINAFAFAMPCGPAVSTSSTLRLTAASRSEAGTTSWTRPISLARAAPNRVPVRKNSRAADMPIFLRT